MNVLYLINHAGKGGSEKYVLTLAKNLIKKANIYFVYHEEGPLVHEMEKICVKAERIKMRHPFDFAASHELAKFMGDNAIDIVHAQYPRENYIAIMAKLLYPKSKIIYTAHWNIKDSPLRVLLNKLLTRADAAVIAVGSKCAELLERNGYPKSRINLIFNGTKPVEAVSCLPADIMVDGNCFVFTCIARLSEEKGLKFLIESAAELKKISRTPFVLLIAGDGCMRDELERLCHDLKLSENVKLLGYRADCGEILAGTGAYINSSRTESFGIATVEAMAHSLPVIVTDVEGNRDIVSKKTDCGIRVPYGDTREMSQAMARLMRDKVLYEHYSVNALKAVKTYFSEEKFVRQTFDVYEKSLREKP